MGILQDIFNTSKNTATSLSSSFSSRQTKQGIEKNTGLDILGETYQEGDFTLKSDQKTDIYAPVTTTTETNTDARSLTFAPTIVTNSAGAQTQGATTKKELTTKLSVEPTSSITPQQTTSGGTDEQTGLDLTKIGTVGIIGAGALGALFIIKGSPKRKR